MALVELIINRKPADLSEDVRIQLDRIVSELRDPLKKTGTVSLPVTLPYTANNKALFFGEDDHQLLGKFRRRYEAQLVVNNVVVVDGIWQQVKNTGKGFVGAIGEAKVSNPKIGDLLLNKKLTDIKSFVKLDYRGSSSIAASWQNTGSFPDAEVCFPFVATSFSDLQFGFRANYEDLGVSHFAAAILKNIFVDAGYTADGEIFGNETFQKLVVMYSSSAKQAWNYGTLAPFRSECTVGFLGNSWDGGVSKVIERQSDNVLVFSYPFVATDGDFAECMGTDGVYTCKFSGNYTLQVRGDAVAGNGSSTSPQAFTAFRCITDNEAIPDNMLPPSGSFSTQVDPLYFDNGTIAVGNGDGGVDMNFVARLEEGKQYAVQRYISVAKSATPPFYYNPNSGKFHCSLVEAPVLLDPATFLPDMSQSEFVNAMFKLFNLYYEINGEQKSITLLTRNSFFKETLKDVIDLTPHLNVANMDEYPLSDKEIAKTYLTYLTDEADHILKHTDYMALVNGDAPEESTKLPFAPLGFLRITHTALNADGTGNETGEDDIPAILPAQTSEDSSVLADMDNATVGGAWTPRLCLYQGNYWIKSRLIQPTPSPSYQYYNVRLGKEYRGTSNIFVGGGAVPISYDYTGPAPKLTFFDVNHQPAYQVTVNTSLRSFAVEKATTPTIYAGAGNAYFLTDVTRTVTLERTSLATNVDSSVNPKGFFYKL
ncbi:hypothetical protein [Hymenobacter siberiensis]|uniref:hypothetical protein n=1 Tax=Hymenobacter siberiensis TaxID=2848396 RepID=UPI001C1E55CB|nr:hypothetical protein [Hymenobacter siberiensis]